MLSVKESISQVGTSFSKLAFYIISVGWISFLIYMLLYIFVLDSSGGENFFKYFLSVESNGIRFRALIFFSPFISTVAGYLVNEREKFLRSTFNSEELYKDLFENANDAIFILDRDFNFTHVNKKAGQLLGYTESELLSRNFEDLLPDKKYGISSGSFEGNIFVTKMQTMSGSIIDVDVSASSIVRDGNPYGARLIIRDVTSLKLSLVEVNEAYDELCTRVKDKDTELKEIKKRLLLEGYERKRNENT